MRALLALLVALLVVCGDSRSACAGAGRRGGTVRLTSASGASRPVELVPAPGGWAGDLSVVNAGTEPLVVSRVAVRGDAADPRVPPKVRARLAEGGLPVTIAPGASRKVSVLWTPEPSVKQRQLFGHVVVTTSDEQSGEVAMGIHAQVAGPLGRLEGHVLSLLLSAPIVGALVLLVLRARGMRDDRAHHAITTAALAIQLALAIYVYRGFAPEVSRVSGNDGLQFVEHTVWMRAIAAELYLGVDGIAAIALLVASATAFFAILPERTIARGASGYYAAFLVADAAVGGALVSMDALLLVLFAAIACLSSAVLVGAWGGPGRRRAAVGVAIVGAVVTAALLVVVLGLAANADPTFLVDGTTTATTFSIPELSRVAFGAKGAHLLGGPLVKVGFVLVAIASIALLAGFPLHRFLGVLAIEASPTSGALVASLLPMLGLTVLLRLGVLVLPEGMRWASGFVVALGAVTVAYGALAALTAPELRRLAACATTAQAGFVLLGAGALTPQGMSGAIVTIAARGLCCSVFLLLVGAIEDRVRTSDVTRLGGIGRSMPAYVAALSAAALGQAGVLGLGGAWGPLLSIFGALPTYPTMTVVAAVGQVVLAVAHFSAMSRLAFGTLDPEWERSPLLEPLGGRMPDLSAREWTSLAPMVALVVVLGLWPAPMLAVTAGTAKDLAAAVSPPGPDQIAFAAPLTSSASPFLSERPERL